jgi:hypothetical protein
MKLKVFKRQSIEIETDLEFPVYLYFQDELSNDTLIKITEKEKITIKYGYGELSISVESNYFIEDWQVNKINLTNEKHFIDSYQEALKTISECVVP